MKKETNKAVSYKLKKGFMPDNPQVIADVYTECNYNAKETAEKFGVALRTIYSWLEREDVKPLVAIEKEIIFDLAKDNLKKALIKGEWKATELALKMLGKDKGYNEKHEVVHSGEVSHRLMPIINYIKPKEITDIPTIEISDKNEDDMSE